MSNRSIQDRTQAFLATGDHFRLGSLVTESSNAATHDLAELCKTDLRQATEIFKQVELAALQTLNDSGQVALALVQDLDRCLNEGHKVFLCGCGATGRLALILESVWRQAPRPGHDESIVAFTAGGDYALVRSLGVFEDRPDLGAKHLLDLGFQDGDILIAITEGGETPFVLGALEQATRTSRAKSWLFFCNPPQLLSNLVQRSRLALENPNVRWHAFETPPMALTGSTRLQASSVLMAFVGAALREAADGKKSEETLSELIESIRDMNVVDLCSIIELESDAHFRSEFCLHRSRSAAMPVLTDTTERAPTFSLAPFESTLDKPQNPSEASRTYLQIPRAKSSLEAWHHLLRRDPRPFRVPEGFTAPNIDLSAIVAFDFSDGVIERRRNFGVETSTYIDVEFGDYDGTTQAPTLLFCATNHDRKHEIDMIASTDPLIRQSQMKYALNLQSTLAMGRIGRFHGNLMTFVRPTNGKLIDRALRTLRALAAAELEKTGSDKLKAQLNQPNGDEAFLFAIFQALDTVSADEPVALRALTILQK